MAKTNDIIRQVAEAAVACEEKKAEDISILELDKAAGGFTDYFVICSGSNPRQIQTISDEVQRRLQHTDGTRPAHVEGYQQADWVLLDYVDFVVHVFSQRARGFYNLERLWKSAKQFSAEELRKKSRARGPRAAAAAKRAGSGSSKSRRKVSAKKAPVKKATTKRASAPAKRSRPRSGKG
jgi:ribosome-associated protein